MISEVEKGKLNQGEAQQKLKGNIKPGDYIRIKDKRIEGYIISINSLNIRLETKKDEIVFIPNMVLFKSEIVKPKKIPKH